MVGLVLVSHSPDLVRGLRDLLLQMEPDVPIGVAGGTEDGEIGTSLDLINAALDTADRGDGAVVLYDLGSAQMTAEAALEFLDEDLQERCLLVDAPLVEGALAAAGAAGGGAGVAEVAAAARAAGGSTDGTDAPGGCTDAPGARETGPEPEHSATLEIRNTQGLHARPAGQIVRALRPLDATVRIERIDTADSANAASMLALVGLGATAGTAITVHASGPQAQDALTQIRALIDDGFGEPLADHEPADDTAADDAPADGTGPVGGSPGLAMGPARWLRQAAPDLPTGGGAVEDERAGLTAARDRVRELLAGSGGPAGDIFTAQAEVLDDPELLAGVDARLTDGVTAARAWWEAISEQRDRVAAMPGPVFAARAADIDDVGRRVLGALGVDVGVVEVDRGEVVVADDLTPSQVQALHDSGASAVVVRHGAPASHMVIVARNLGLAMTLRVGDAVDDISDGVIVIVDGDRGRIEIDPPDERRRLVGDELMQRHARERERRAAAQATVTGADGRLIEVAANVASVQEAELAIASGADGVGLLRTEFLFGERSALPSEDEQVAALDAILRVLDGRPAIIRTLDIGGDKPSPALQLDPVRNGFLGVRGLRLSLERPEMFRTQLRAVLRVAVEHQVRIMFPFVTTAGELVAARRELDRARAELDDAGVASGRIAGIGAMIEIPVAALHAGPLLEHVDFVSIGTNDLFQYLTAAGRTIDEVSHLPDAAREVFDDLLTGICAAAHRGDRWVGVCGEIAGEPETAAHLVGLGVTELSMRATAIPDVKAALRDSS
jgi:phosphocarrier protein FPr